MAGSIVCGVEDSAGARSAVAVAFDLAVDLARPLVLVHVTDRERCFPYGDSASRERRRHAAWQQGHALVADARRRHVGHAEISDEVKTGRPDVELARAASDEQADLLVVGSRGRGEIGSALLGSVSQSLERLSPCPVLVVPTGCQALKGEQPEEDETVICGIADPESQAGLVEFSAGLAGALRARLDVVHADPSDGWNGTLLSPATGGFWLSGGAPDGNPGLLPLETAMHLAEAHGVQADVRLASGPAALALQRVAERERGRLIVIGSHGSGRLRSLLRGSVSRQLAKFGSTPILIVPEDGTDRCSARRLRNTTGAYDATSEVGTEPHGLLR